MHMFSILLATGNYKTIHVKMSDSIKNSGKPLSWEPSLAHITAFFLDLVWPTCGQLAKCGFRYAPGWALSEMFIMIFFFFLQQHVGVIISHYGFLFFVWTWESKFYFPQVGSPPIAKRPGGRVSPNVSCLDEKVVVLMLLYSLEEVGLSVLQICSLHNVIERLHIFFVCLNWGWFMK